MPVTHLQTFIHVGTNVTGAMRMWGGGVGGIAQSPVPLLGNLIVVLVLHLPRRAAEILEETRLCLALGAATNGGLVPVLIPLPPPLLLRVETMTGTRNIIEAETKIEIVTIKNPSISIGVAATVVKGEREKKRRGIKRYNGI